MKLFDTEYRIEIYNDMTGEWEIRSSCSSKEEAISTLAQLRQVYCESVYRLCELTISSKVIDE